MYGSLAKVALADYPGGLAKRKQCYVNSPPVLWPHIAEYIISTQYSSAKAISLECRKFKTRQWIENELKSQLATSEDDTLVGALTATLAEQALVIVVNNATTLEEIENPALMPLLTILQQHTRLPKSSGLHGLRLVCLDRVNPTGEYAGLKLTNDQWADKIVAAVEEVCPGSALHAPAVVHELFVRYPAVDRVLPIVQAALLSVDPIASLTGLVGSGSGAMDNVLAGASTLDLMMLSGISKLNDIAARQDATVAHKEVILDAASVCQSLRSARSTVPTLPDIITDVEPDVAGRVLGRFVRADILRQNGDQYTVAPAWRRALHQALMGAGTTHRWVMQYLTDEAQ